MIITMTRNIDNMDMEALLDVMGCRTRREIINLLREEPRFVSQISKELQIGQKAIIEHLRAMEEVGILDSFFKKIERGRPRKYYNISNDIHLSIIINKNTFKIDLIEEDEEFFTSEWSRLMKIETRIKKGDEGAVKELEKLIKVYESLKRKAEKILEENPL